MRAIRASSYGDIVRAFLDLLSRLYPNGSGSALRTEATANGGDAVGGGETRGYGHLPYTTSIASPKL